MKTLRKRVYRQITNWSSSKGTRLAKCPITDSSAPPTPRTDLIVKMCSNRCPVDAQQPDIQIISNKWMCTSGTTGDVGVKPQNFTQTSCAFHMACFGRIDIINIQLVSTIIYNSVGTNFTKKKRHLIKICVTSFRHGFSVLNVSVSVIHNMSVQCDQMKRGDQSCGQPQSFLWASCCVSVGGKFQHPNFQSL